MRLLLVGLMISTVAKAQSSSDTVRVSYGAFVDSYYAFDSNHPSNRDRAFTTQPARDDEFNVNLAFVEAKVTGAKIRGRLALQAGTSVQSNYSGEPADGSVSGPSLSQHIQEAVAGYRLSPSTWIDAGIFFSHIGMESFISRDNLTYTRSLSADYTPYYETGVKLSWNRARVTTVVAVVNGWQLISENNRDKSVGGRIDYALSPRATLTYYNLAGRENATRDFRYFNGVGFKVQPVDHFSVQANADFGMQNRAGKQSTWRSAALVAALQPHSRASMSARVEGFSDPDQVVIATQTSSGFRAFMVSAGIDVGLSADRRAIWRSEARGTWADAPVFPARAGTRSSENRVVVSSLALTF